MLTYWPTRSQGFDQREWQRDPVGIINLTN